MAKPPLQKARDARGRTQHASGQGKRTNRFLKTLMVFGFFILISFVYYGNTLGLKYALDDTIVVTGNAFTKEGIGGIGDILSYDLFAGYFGKDQNMVAGGRYRPLSLVSFALEYEIFGENPAVSHFFNVLLLAITAFVIFLWFRALFQVNGPSGSDETHWWQSIPFITALLFIAHPVHTEVVANIKGRDEILSLLFSLLSALALHNFLEKGKTYRLFLGGGCFFLGLMSKENTLTFLAVIPLAYHFFGGNNWKRLGLAMISPLVASLLFFALRQAVIGGAHSPLADDLMNNPFVEMSWVQKYATIFYTLGLYLKLLVFPHPLTYDYYPYHIPIINPGDWRAIVPVAIYLGLGLFALWGLKTRNLYAFAIVFFLVTLSITSNVFFPIGVFMNERFLFMSSLGFCFALALFLFRQIPGFGNRPFAGRTIAFGILTVLLVLAGFKTISRNRVWYDSSSLFLNDIKVSENSAKGNAIACEYLIYKAKETKDSTLRDSLLRDAIRYGHRAVSIYPKQIIGLFNLAAAYYEYNQNYDSILSVYKTILTYLPNEEKVYQNFNSIMGQAKDNDQKIRLYKSLLTVNTERFDVNLNLGVLLLFGKNEPAEALPFLEKASGLNPSDFDAVNNLGLALAYLNRWSQALENFLKAEKIRPGDGNVTRNIGVCYSRLGNQPLASRYLEMSGKAQPTP